LQIAVNDEAPVAAEWMRKRDRATGEPQRSHTAVQAPASLTAGWNKVSVMLTTTSEPRVVQEEGFGPCQDPGVNAPQLRLKTVDLRFGDQ
jgi:hypothetical protein